MCIDKCNSIKLFFKYLYLRWIKLNLCKNIKSLRLNNFKIGKINFNNGNIYEGEILNGNLHG